MTVVAPLGGMQHVELRNLIRTVRKGWALITVMLLVGLGGAAVFSILQSPKYLSTAKVFVSTQSTGSTSDFVQGNSFIAERVSTYTDLATTPIVLIPVIGTLNLGLSPADLAVKVTATAPIGTSIIDISVLDTDAERAAATANAISTSLATIVKEIETPDAAGATSLVKLTRAQEAVVGDAPVSPNVALNLLLGGFVGLVLGVGVTVLRQTLDTTIRNEHDVKQFTDVPILGGIDFDRKASQRPLIVHVDPSSTRAESFRALRTNLQFLDVGRVDRSFVITSSIEREGKSTTSANLAITLADAGLRVLLVDADLRRPKVADYMGLEGAVGLTDVLIGKAQLGDVVQSWGKNELYVLPAGTVPPNPSELLGSGAMVQLIDEFNKNFDVVLYDTPPLLPVTDAAILAKKVGSAIVVAAAGRAHKHQLVASMNALTSVDVPVSGLVLTMLPTKGPDAYGYAQYAHKGEYAYAQRPVS